MVGPPTGLGASLFVGLVPFALIAWLVSVTTAIITSPDPTVPYTPDPLHMATVIGVAGLAYLAMLARVFGFFDALFSLSGWSLSRIGLGLAGGLASLGLGWLLADPSLTVSASDALLAGRSQTLATLALPVFAVVIFLPWFEETVFRGWAQPALIDSGHSPVIAIVVVAIVFALFHPADFLGAFATGLILGALRHVTGNLIAPLIAHMVHNGLVLALIMSASV